MSPYRSICFLMGLMGPYASLSILMCLYRPLCVLMDSNGSLKVFSGFYASLWVLMSSFVLMSSLCVFMGPNGSLLVFMRPYGFQWVLMGLYWSLCVLVGPYASS